MSANYPSWGGIVGKLQHITPLHWVPAQLPTDRNAGTLLPRGMGRSYGDSCLNDNGVLLDATRLDHFISFDTETGVLRAEAGVTLDQALQFVVGKGWFLPVTPGTRFVTLGGAIANDVHGKNHHRAGTFGRHILQFELLRSDGSRLICSAEQNTELYQATIGGLGLTGLICWVELQLKPIAGPLLETTTIPFASVADFVELSDSADKEFEHTVAWVDALGRGSNLGRGVFFCGNHSHSESRSSKRLSKQRLSIPFNLPSIILNPLTMRVFNSVYYRTHQRVVKKNVHYEPFFYPLDGIQNWNRIYGKRGFFQYQCVVPREHGVDAINEILERTTRSRQGSFLSVLKNFGTCLSPGMLSFPRPGITLALDFPNRGQRTLDLMDDLDQVVLQAKGAVYPAKDARMSAESFQSYYPNWREFSDLIDPAFSSSFWRRVSGDVSV